LLQSIEIVNNTDITVNVIDSQTNETIGTVPAKYVELTHTDAWGRGVFLLVLSNDMNMGYVLHPVTTGLETDIEAPSFVRLVFDSFELVNPPQHP
jgi:hypothetical protein